MVFTVGICDDNQQQTEMIERYLDKQKGRYALNVITSTNPEEFLARLKTQKPHIVFLDIDMGETNGIQLGERIKALYKDAVIIYITGHEQYAVEAYRIRAFHYLLKPLAEEKFAKVFLEAVKTMFKESVKKPESQKFKLQRKGLVEYIDYDAIFYFEKVGRKVTVQTECGVLEYHGSFADLLEAIDTSVFIQCHQGFIINKSKLRAYRDKDLYLEGNRRIPVSRSYAAEIKEMLAKRLFEEEDDL